MKKIIAFALFISSLNAFSTECTGIVKCGFEYSKMTNYELEFDKKVNFGRLTLINDNLELNKDNVYNEFEIFLNDNMIDLAKTKSFKGVISSLREPEYNYAPIVMVRKDDIPPFINPQGPVTLVYKFTKNLETLKNKKINKLNEKVKVIEFKDKIFASGKYDDARNFMEELIKEDNK